MNALLLTLLAATPAPDLRDDPVMGAMRDEVSRAIKLSMPQRPKEAAPDKPYLVQAYVSTEDTLGVKAELGALFAPTGGRRLRVQTEVRVGTPQLDNTNFFGGDFSRTSPPAEEDLDALRRALWLSFDGDYKSALESIARKRAYLKANQVKELLPDWGAAPAEVVLLPLDPPLTLSSEKWSGIARRSSAACRSFPSPQSCSVALNVRRYCQRSYASDGAINRFCETRYELLVNATGQAPDGMSVGWEWRAVVHDESELPDEAALTAHVKEVGETLEAKIKARPPTEDYAGPVLFTGEAAAAFFLSALGSPLSHPRASLGANEQGRLTERLGKHIAVKELSATDDPTKDSWTSPAGVKTHLQGFFPVDDDGVTPKPITLVEKGVLRTYYMSRLPTARIAATNGHARAGRGSVGNLFVSTSAPVALAELKAKLVELAKEEDLDYGLMVSALPRGQDSRPGSAQLQLPRLPTLVYRVYADGHTELVRGYAFKPTSFRVLKELVAMGDDPVVFNTEHLGQNVAVIAPSVLVRSLELTRPGDDQKPPVLPRPKLLP